MLRPGRGHSLLPILWVVVVFSHIAVDHSAADWDTLGLNFTSLFAHVPASAHPGPGQDAVVAMLREQLTQALGADAVAAEGESYGAYLMK